MPARDDDSALVQEVDELERAFELGREGHLGDRPGLEQALEERAIGIAPVGLRMGAEALRGEERPLEVRAEHPWPDRFGRQRAQGGDQVGFGCGDEGRLERGHPRRQERFAGLAVALGIRRGEVDAAEAVDVEVDEAGDGDPAPIPPGQCNLGQGAVRERHVAGHEDALDDRGFDAEPHRPSRLRLTTPPAAWSLERAPSASRPESSETIATFASPSAAARAVSTCSSEAFVASATARRARARSLALLATRSTIRLPKVLPSRTIETVEIVLRISFWAVPAFMRVDPAMTSGPTTAATSWSTESPEVAVMCADDADRQGTRGAGRADRSENVGGPAAGGERDDRVVGADVDRRQVGAAGIGVVLGRFLGDGSGIGAAGDDGEDLTGRHAEGRAAFGGVDEREPSRGACADVDEAPSALEPLDDRIDRGGQAGGCAANGCGDGRVLLVDAAPRAPASTVGRGLRVPLRQPR